MSSTSPPYLTFLLFYFFTFLLLFVPSYISFFLSIFISFSLYSILVIFQTIIFIHLFISSTLPSFFLLFLLLEIWLQKLSLSHSPYNFISYFLSSIGDYLLELEKTVGMAGRTEIYRCERCSQLTRFSRFEVKLKLPYISL